MVARARISKSMTLSKCTKRGQPTEPLWLVIGWQHDSKMVLLWEMMVTKRNKQTNSQPAIKKTLMYNIATAIDIQLLAVGWVSTFIVLFSSYNKYLY